MNILLINPKIRERAVPNCFPTGLGYITAVLMKEGHAVEVLDWNAYRWSVIDFQIELVLQDIPDIIGLTGIITQYIEVKKIAAKCKYLWPDVPIVCGGPLATSVPKLLFAKTEVDMCVLGEGEKAIVEIVEYIQDGLWEKEFSNREFPVKMELIKDLSTIPWPAYDFFPMDIYLKNPIGPYNPNKWKDGRADAPLTMNMIGSRGCPAKCIYCFHNYMGQGYRVRPYNDMIMEMDHLYREYGAEYIHMVDDAFACNKKKMLDFCLAFKGRDYKWSCAGRANVMDEEMISKMAEAGCVGVWYGLESGSQRMLDAMNKKLTVKQYEKVIELNRKYFEYEDFTFIVGSPGEVDETVDESIRFCKDMGIRPSAVFFMTPYPGTQLFKDLLADDSEFKLMVNNIDRFEQWIISLGEQGERMAWNCSGSPDEKVYEWHQKFIEETDALNRREK